MSRKFGNIAVLIEFTVSSGLAVLFHWVLDYKEVGYVIFAVGILLSLSTYLQREDMEKAREELQELYHKSHEIIFAISCIPDPECLVKANELMTGTKTTIRLLQEGYIPLDETEFYMEATKEVENAGNLVKCVDPVTSGWDRASLFNFYQSNLRAMERGVQITRIFVLNRDALAIPDIQNVILPQIQDGISCRVAFRDELPLASDNGVRYTTGSFDFAVYDDRTVTEVFGRAGKFFGRKTTRPAEVAKFLHFYDLIAHSSHSVTVDNGKVAVVEFRGHPSDI